MNKNEDITPSAIPGTTDDFANQAAMPPAGPSGAEEPAVESGSELASIISPPIAPTISDMSTEALGAPKVERPVEQPVAAEKFEEAKPQRAHDSAPVSRDIIPLVARSAGRATRKLSKFTLAASIVLAAAVGATAGALSATGLARLFNDTATADQSQNLPATIAQLQSEIAALKSSVDTTSRITGAQYSKLVERFDRIEHMQSVATKTDAALPRETTGSITLPSAAAVPLPAAPLPPALVPSPTMVPGWAVRDVYRGVAMLQSRLGGLVEVEPGDVLPSLGRIESIRRQDGRWVVMTSKGMITSMR